MSDDAVELVLYIENDGDLYRQQYQPILKNLANKRANGIYQIPAAQKLMGYLVESGAKKYAKEFGSPGQPWHKMFSVAVRKEAAADLEKKFRAEDDLGAYKHLLTKAALKRLEHGHSDCAKSGVLAKACRTASGHASGSSAVRYSGELVLRVSWKERPGPNGTYTVHISRGGKKLSTQHVGAPASLSHAVDSSKAYDEAAHAAISFSDEDVQEYAASDEKGQGWHIGRSVTAKWPKAGRSAGKSANNAAKMPPLSKWDTFAGGTSAPSNSTSYSITFNGRKYMISPLGARNNVERLAGYALDVFPGEYHGWTRIGHFSRAASAAKAASIYAGKH